MTQPLAAHMLARLPGIRHGFFTRAGGVSEGVYASLNAGVGSNDAPRNVAENRARVILDEAEVPLAMAEAFRVGNFFGHDTPPETKGNGRPN